jgi:hypothetical protein
VLDVGEKIVFAARFFASIGKVFKGAYPSSGGLKSTDFYLVDPAFQSKVFSALPYHYAEHLQEHQAAQQPCLLPIHDMCFGREFIVVRLPIVAELVIVGR